MKFSNTLEATMLPEWRQYYIDYKGLKKVLKQVCTAVPAPATSSLTVLQP